MHKIKICDKISLSVLDAKIKTAVVESVDIVYWMIPARNKQNKRETCLVSIDVLINFYKVGKGGRAGQGNNGN